MAKPTPLPKRFQPFLQQAQTETAIRYGGQEDALGSILSSLAHDYGQQAAAQHTAGMSVLGALEGADTNLQQVYSQAGLTPGLLAQISNSPTGQRLAGELASGRAGIQNQILGQQQGQQYLQGHIGDMYQQDRGKVTDQIASLEKEKGLYGSSLLDSLISGDRATRHSANVAFRAQQHADAQARADRNATQENALIGQGLLPDASGNLQPLPGGKADPNAPANQPKKPKRTTGPGTASSDAQRTAALDFSSAFSNAQSGLKDKVPTSQMLQGAVDSLVAGRPATTGGVIYDTVPVKDAYGRATGKTKQVPRLDPKTGQRVTGPSSPAVPPVPRPVAQAAVEQAAYGYVTTATVRALQKLGYSVNQIPGLKTETQARVGQRHTTPNRSSANVAPDGSGGSRPT